MGLRLLDDLLEKWPRQLLPAVDSPCGTVVEAWEASYPKTLKRIIVTFSTEEQTAAERTKVA